MYLLHIGLAICVFGKALTGVEASCGQRLGGARIVNGQTANPNSWPWQLSLRKYGGHICGASLITPQWAVTAAHCIATDMNPFYYDVLVGAHHVSGQDGLGKRYNVVKMIKHRGYARKHIQNDIALLKLSRPVRLSRQVNTVCLPEQGQTVSPNARCFATGWGRDDGVTQTVPDYLQQTQLPIIDYDQCKAVNGEGVHEPSMLCAGGGGTTICMGDSGGPLVCEEHGRWVLRGASSWVKGKTCPVNKFSVFARVSSYVDWVADHIGFRPTQPITSWPSVPSHSSSTTKQPTHRPHPTKPSGSCVDNDPSGCTSMADYCDLNFVEENCKKTCNSC